MTRRIDILIFEDFQLLDAAGPLTTFEEAAGAATQPSYYELRVIAKTAGAVTSSSGARLFAERFPNDVADTLIVAGGWGTASASACTETLSFVRAAAEKARRIGSVCSGAFILAGAGVLDGRRVTTHWGRATELSRKFPHLRVEPDRIFIKDGSVWSSAGISAGIDLALAMVAEDLGEHVAKRAAQQMVVYFRRPGGQSQFSALLDISAPSGRFSPVLAWARERLAEQLPVERLAAHAGMSARNFARTFATETGTTPAKAVERLRLETARQRVEETTEPVEQIAAQVGFGDPERMRRAFVRAFGQPPQALRRAARFDRAFSN